MKNQAQGLQLGGGGGGVLCNAVSPGGVNVDDVFGRGHQLGDGLPAEQHQHACAGL